MSAQRTHRVRGAHRERLTRQTQRARAAGGGWGDTCAAAASLTTGFAAGFGLLCATVSLAGAATLFALVDTGELFDSVDDGVSWTVRSTLPVRDAVALVAGASASDLLLATRSGLVYTSDDAGISWTATGAVAASDVVDMVLRFDGGVVLLSEAGTLWESMDGGVSFTALATIAASNHVGLTIGAANDVYALTATGEVYASADGGETWLVQGVIATPHARGIAASGSNLHVLTTTGDIWESDDAGATWAAVGTLSQVRMRGFVRDGGRLYAAAAEGEVAMSDDAASWTWVGAVNQLNVVALAIDTPATDVTTRAGARFAVGVPWPNPAPGRLVAFPLRLPVTTGVSVEVFDVRGRKVVQRAPQAFEAGPQILWWDTKELSSGIYFVRLKTRRGEDATTSLVISR